MCKFGANCGGLATSSSKQQASNCSTAHQMFQTQTYLTAAVTCGSNNSFSQIFLSVANKYLFEVKQILWGRLSLSHLADMLTPFWVN